MRHHNHRTSSGKRAGSGVSISGQVVVRGFDADCVKTFEDCLSERKSRQGEVYADAGRNLIVDAGSAQVVQLCIGGNTDSFTHCGVGSGTAAVTAAQTDLASPIVRNPITSRYPVANAAHYDTFFDSATGNGTWNETGIFTAVSGGTMGSRKVLGSPFAKGTGNTATVAWAWTLTSV